MEQTMEAAWLRPSPALICGAEKQPPKGAIIDALGRQWQTNPESSICSHFGTPGETSPPQSNRSNYNYLVPLPLTRIKSPKSNRRYPRIPTPKGIWVSWQHDGAQHVSRVRDLNVGGLFIDAPNPPPVGTSITLLFSVPEGEIRSSALVKNVTPGEGMGVQFVAMSQEHAVRLQTLFSRLLRSSDM